MIVRLMMTFYLRHFHGGVSEGREVWALWFCHMAMTHVSYISVRLSSAVMLIPLD